MSDDHRIREVPEPPPRDVDRIIEGQIRATRNHPPAPPPPPPPPPPPRKDG